MVNFNTEFTQVSWCRLMKNKGLKKVLHKTELIEDVSGDSNEEDTSTSFSDDDEMQEKLEKKYGLRS